MPQLDVVTFWSQYCWTLFSLFTMFVFVMIYLMPKLKSNFKIRAGLESESITSSSSPSALPLIKRILQN
uniref:ATP synthase F0 subunit 8 n=1 Tax=Cubaia aphrodite TaxID=1104540 RepID=G9ISN0_CUBAP|nr:ATP synthase F0 subunit 8 [Cubaia aphrodite]AER54529.1 ATP synthase F0 subunit 8 [Cubaia aphrodite]